MNKKWVLAIALLVFLPMALLAQEVSAEEETTEPSDTTTLIRPSLICFGYLSYDAALKSMPEYASAQKTIQANRTAFEQEMQRVENEFNEKYESFLEGQKDFPRTILLKRQNELQELMKRNLEFKAQAREELQQTEERVMKPVHDRLNEVLAEVAREFSLALIINTDTNACPFIDPRMGMNIQEEVNGYLKSKK